MFKKNTFINFCYLALLFVFFIFSSIVKAQGNKPNIIFFLVDDMGWQDTSVPFWKKTTDANRKFKTPAMERLAQQGVKFEQAYSNAICTPSRVSLLTGMNVARHRVTNWTMYKNTYTDAKDDSILQAPQWNVNGLSPQPGLENSVFATPLPQLLKDAGYYTIMCGKAHFAADKTPGADPLNLGFVKNIGGSAAGNPSSYFGEQNYGNKPGTYNLRGIPGLEKYWGSSTFLTEALTIEAKKAMDTALQNKQPFFLYMAHYAVHLPFDADKRFIEKYNHLPKDEAAYAALVEGMDKSLGDLMDYLEEKNLSQNTIIIFLSDNGGYTRAPRMGPPDTQNYPLRAGKGSLFEGGIRVPMLVKWPGVANPNSRSNQYVAIQDMFPTILQMADVKPHGIVQKVDGKSIVRYIKKPSKHNNRKTILWHFPNKWTKAGENEPDEFVSYSSALRKGDWKIIYYYRTQKAVLYNIKNDIGEQHDLSNDFPARRKRMLKLLIKQLKENGAQLPVYKKTSKVVPYPVE